MAHQVFAKRNLCCLKTILHQPVLQQTGIEHDVSVVRHKQIMLVRRQPLQPRNGKRRHAARNDLFVHLYHRIMLKFAHRLKRPDAPTHLFQRFRRIDKRRQQRKHVARRYALHGRQKLLLVIRTNIVKLTYAVHNYQLSIVN